jgi:hypothetical protein
MSQSTAAEPRVARLTVGQVHAMTMAGILPESPRTELIDGLLVYKDRSAHGEDPMTIGKRHNLVVKLLGRLDPELAKHGCHMQTQGPVSLPPYDEPEPDGAVLRGEPRDYSERLPEGADAHCVIEVADASLDYDRTTKLEMYARAGVPQYVIVNLREGCLEVHEQPVREEQRYARALVLGPGERVALRVGDDARVEVGADRILP